MAKENIERINTVNLAKAWDTQKYRITDRVINIIKEFTRRHMQTNKVKIDQDLNRHIWSRGKKNPPRKIRWRMIKEDDDTDVVSSFIEEKRSEEHTSELQSLMRISYAVFGLKKNRCRTKYHTKDSIKQQQYT